MSGWRGPLNSDWRYAVRCGECGAPPGQHCRSLAGVDRPRHSERVAAAMRRRAERTEARR